MSIHISPRRALAAATSLIVLALAVGGGASLAQGDADASAAEPGYQELTLGAADYAFAWPESIEAGRTRIVMENTGQEAHHAQLVRLNDGVSPDDAIAALPNLEVDPAALFSLVTLQGGPSIIAPGATQEVILDLEPGTYVWICGIPAADGEPHFAKGMITSFEVAADGSQTTEEPPVDGTLSMQDFAFVLPEAISAGPQLWKAVNEGEQPHEFILGRLAPGATAMDFAMAAFDPTAAEDPPGLPVGGLQAVEPGTTAWVGLDLEPGTYAAVCFVPDPDSGQPHLALGMAVEFSVEEQAV